MMNKTILLAGTLCCMAFSCHRNNSEGTAGQAEALPVAAENEVQITVEQYRHAGMEEAGWSDFTASEAVPCNGYIDVPPQNRHKVSAILGGNVIMADLLPGDRVRKGQTILSLQNIEFLKLQQDFLESKEKLVYLKSVYETQSSLAGENIASKRNEQQARSEYMSMQATYQSLAKQLRLIHIDPEGVTAENMASVIPVISPINGFISDIKVDNGMFVPAAAELCEVVNPEHFHLELKVFEKDVAKVGVGQPVEFWLPDAPGKAYKGKTILIGKTIEGADRVVMVHGHIADEGKPRFTPGMYVEARIMTQEHSLRGLPAEALVNSEGNDFVFVRKSFADSLYTFEKMLIKAGVKTDRYVEVLNTGDFKDPAVSFLVKGAFNLN